MKDAPPSNTEYTSPPPPNERGIQLRRDATNRVLGGVCSGLARAVDLDTAWVRVAFVLAALSGGVPVLIGYVVATFVIPRAAHIDEIPPASPATPRTVRAVIGIAAALGLLSVLGFGLGLGAAGMRQPFSTFSPSGPFGGAGGLLGLALLLVAGVWLLGRAQGDRGSGWVDDAAPARGPTPSDVRVGDGPAPEAVGDEPSDSFVEDLYGPLPQSSPAVPAAPSTPPALILARIIGWMAVIWFAGAAAAAAGLWALGIAEVRWPAAVAVAGAAGLAAAVVALRRSPSVQPLLAALAGLVIAAVLAGNLVMVPGTISDVYYTPRSLADLKAEYRVAFGQLNLNLTQLEIPVGTHRDITLDLAGGKLSVRVPENVDVEVEAYIGLGELDLLGPARKGFRLQEHSVDRAPVSSTAKGGQLNLTLTVGVGEIDLSRVTDFNAPRRVLDTGRPILLQCTPSAEATTCQHPRGTDFPELDCWVDGPRQQALCRPVGGIAEIAEPWPGDPGQQHCRVPAGGGAATECRPAPRPPVATEVPAGLPNDEQPYLCTKVADGTLWCRPAVRPAT